MNLFRKKQTLYLLLIASTIMMMLMLYTGKDLTTAATPMGIIDLELASDQPDVQKVLAAWEKNSSDENNLINESRINTFLDFLFLVVYTLLFYTCSLMLAGALAHKKLWPKILHRIAGLALFAGLLDIVENLGMLVSLYGNSTNTVALITSLASYLKWSLVLSTTVTILVAFFYKTTLIKKRSKIDSAFAR